jgi:nicotinamide-nucleotide amidase
MKELINTIAKQSKSKNLKLVTAESCTGGGIAYQLTSVPGSSEWFERGFVTYSNESKKELLHVPDMIINNFGAVSEETAQAMAEGALRNSHADIAMSVTGVAGPDGGTEEKPVGTVCFGLATKSGTIATKTQYFTGNRASIREQSIVYSLESLIDLCFS